MPAPYSQDLRERVIGFMALGGSARAAATRFEVSISSALRWAQRWRAEGHARPRAMGGDRRSRLGEHGARVLQLVAQQPDLNPIEQAFAKYKALLRKAAERTVDGLWHAIGRITDLFPPAECRNFFNGAGYAT